jgi:RND family efflux transporter MFP subunit
MTFLFDRKKYDHLILLIGSVMVLLSACSKEEVEKDVPRPVRTVVIKAESAVFRRIYPAVVLPAQQAELAFKVSGRVTELPLRAATQVKGGDAIAQLDKREFEAAVARLESQRKAAKAQLDKQRKQLDRFQQLVSQGTIAQADFEKERAKLTSDQAAIDEIDTQLSEAKADLEETTLRAPFDGIIASRNVEDFANVQANSVVVVLQALETIDLQYDVPGTDVAIFGQKKDIQIKARLDVAPGREFDAQSVEFSTQADPATQTFRGRVSMDYPEDVTVLPGMTGSIIASTEQNSVTKRKVTPLSLTGNNMSINGGLEAGEIVVTAGVSFLREGMIVKPITDGSK